MPIVVVGAIAAGAAVATGVAVTTVAMVGLATTVVGKLTKSKELSQLGAGIGLGAGIASVGQAVFGAGTAAAGTSATAGTVEAGSAALENTISSADLAGIDAAAGGIGGGATLPDAISVSTSWDMPATAVESFSSAGEIGKSVTDSTGMLGSISGQAAPAAATPAVQTPTTPTAPTAPQVKAPAEAGITSGTSASGPVDPPPGTDSNAIAKWWSQQTDTTKNRILQMGSSAVGGLFDGWTSDQKLALERERQNLEQQRYNTAVANGNAQPVIRYANPAGGLLASTKG